MLLGGSPEELGDAVEYLPVGVDVLDEKVHREALATSGRVGTSARDQDGEDPHERRAGVVQEPAARIGTRKPLAREPSHEEDADEVGMLVQDLEEQAAVVIRERQNGALEPL